MTDTQLDSPIVATVPFDKDGIHHGFLRLPYSRDDSAWGSIMIPLTVVRNGEGPTVLLTGGNHGDEYEGPVALFGLAQELDPLDVSGCVIIVPAMNYPAFRAATRTSPIDRGNMNRIFPGRPDGTVTEKIADYFQRVLLPMCDIVLDFHSGGKTLEFIPFAAAHVLPDPVQEEKCFSAVKAFGAPYSLKMVEIDSRGMFDTAIEEMGKVFVTTELGGGGTVSARTAEIARQGVRNVLRHVGILAGDVVTSPTQWLDMPGDESFVFAEQDGLLEMCVDLEAAVKKGQTIARIHTIDRTGVAPTRILAPCNGILIARHFPGLIKMGDCVASFGVVIEDL